MAGRLVVDVAAAAAAAAADVVVVVEDVARHHAVPNGVLGVAQHQDQVEARQQRTGQAGVDAQVLLRVVNAALSSKKNKAETKENDERGRERTEIKKTVEKSWNASSFVGIQQDTVRPSKNTNQ